MTPSRVVIAALGLALAFALPAAAQQEPQRDRHLTRYGLSVTLPAAWHGSVYRRTGGLPILHVANFRLPSGDDDTGSRAIKKMRKTSVFIVLMESRGTSGFHWRKLAGPPQVRRSDFLPLFKGVPPTHAFARVLFTTRQRYFQLWVQFGARPAPARLLKQANRLLTTLKVAHS
jgi:hypothetical protein